MSDSILELKLSGLILFLKMGLLMASLMCKTKLMLLWNSYHYGYTYMMAWFGIKGKDSKNEAS